MLGYYSSPSPSTKMASLVAPEGTSWWEDGRKSRLKEIATNSRIARKTFMEVLKSVGNSATPTDGRQIQE